MSSIKKNAPCPCGSGKKYKRCCEMMPSNQNNTVRLNFDVCAHLRQFTFESAITWLQAIICHPANQSFINRLEFFIAQLFSIPAIEFQGKEMVREDVVQLFDRTKSAYDKLFISVEDFEGYPQEKLIPLFFDDKRYYIFYAGMERPYEDYINFIDRYFTPPIGFLPEFKTMKTLFMASLELQTNLLQRIIDLDEKGNGWQGMIYIPSENFVQSIRFLFTSQQMDFDEIIESENKLTQGAFSTRNLQEMLNKCIVSEIFDQKLFFETSNGINWLFPHVHYKAFLDAAATILQSRNFTSQLQKQLSRKVSRVVNELSGVYVGVAGLGIEGNLIDHSIDHMIFPDKNKLILFKAAEYQFVENLSDSVSAAIDSVGKTILQLENANEIEIYLKSGNRIIIAASKLEIIPIILFDVLKYNFQIGLSKSTWKTEQRHILSLADLNVISRELQTSSNFIKYLSEENNLRKNNKGAFLGEYMDRFAFYVQNDFSFFRSAIQLGNFLFLPHEWHAYIHDKLHKQFADEDSYLEIHRKARQHYNIIENSEPGLYKLTQTSDTSGAFMISFPESYLWILMPDNAQLLNQVDFSLSYNLISELIKEYLYKNQSKYVNVLTALNLHPVRHTISVNPQDRIKGSYLEFAMSHYSPSNLGADIITFIDNDKNELLSVVIFDGEKFSEQFALLTNDGERITLQLFFSSLFRLKGYVRENAMKKALEIVDSFLPVSRKRYSAEMVDVFNPKFGNYNPPVDFNESDFGIATRFISTYLIANKMNSGEYTGQDAIDISRSLYKHILLELEELIKTYDTTFLPFAYKQLELAEGARYLNNIGIGMKVDVELNYNLSEYLSEKEAASQILTGTNRLLVQLALKVKPNGLKLVSKHDWSYLLALGKIAIDTSNIYEYLVHGLLDAVLRITDDYLLEMKTSHGDFNTSQFHEKGIDISIKHHKDRFENSRRLLDLKSPRILAFEKHKDELNLAFIGEYGFSYDDLIFVLHALSSSSLEKGGYFPIVVCDLKDIVTSVQQMDTLHMETGYIESIVSFLSIEEGFYGADNMLLQGELLRQKERLWVSPILKLAGGAFVYGVKCTYNAALNWNNLIKGVFLYDLLPTSKIQVVVKAMHKTADEILEEQVATILKTVVQPNDVESKIENFKRLSPDFPRRPPCGEIDVLCINRQTKVIFVLEVKNVIKKPSNYYVKASIKEFFLSNNSYYSKLIRKKQFVQDNMMQILQYFNIESIEGWILKEAFITYDLQVAAFYNHQNVDFILIDELKDFVTTDFVTP